MANTTPSTREEMLRIIETEWVKLLAALERLTPQEMVTPDAGGWSPKDNLAHLTGWMKILREYHFGGRPAPEVLGVDPAVTRDWDFDTINAAIFAQNQARSSEDVVDELKGTYARVIEMLSTTPFETILQPRFPDDPARRPMLLWVLNNTSNHFKEHVQRLQ
jgi:hypothetical protein